MASTVDLSRIRVDHIGSLVRPEKLKQVFARYDRGRATQEELKKAQDEAIRDVIRKQQDHGLPIVTDGEFRRHGFQESFSECVSGFEVPNNVSLYYESAMSIKTRWNVRNRILMKPARRLSRGVQQMNG